MKPIWTNPCIEVRLDRMVQSKWWSKDEVHDDGDGHVMVIKLQTWKKESKKQNGLKAKVYLIGPFCFGDQNT